MELTISVTLSDVYKLRLFEAIVENNGDHEEIELFRNRNCRKRDHDSSVGHGVFTTQASAALRRSQAEHGIAIASQGLPALNALAIAKRNRHRRGRGPDDQ